MAIEMAARVRQVLERRDLRVLFQPIWGFREARIVGFEALARGPAGTPLESPLALFAAARAEGIAVALNIVCMQETLRAYARLAIDARLFVNVSPELLMTRGFDQQRAARFMHAVGLDPDQVVMEITEDYPALDFRAVEESLMLYRGMGFHVA